MPLAPHPTSIVASGAITLNNGQAGDSLTDGFPTILCPAGRLPIQKNGGKA
jgi:hypothetical protein